MKKNYTLKLGRINAIKDFVNKVANIKSTLKISTANSIVDAKSIMGLFSLDLNKNIPLELDTNTLDDTTSKEDIAKFESLCQEYIC